MLFGINKEDRYNRAKNNLPVYSLSIKLIFQKKDHTKLPRYGYHEFGIFDKFDIELPL